MPGTGKVTLSNLFIADAELPFTLLTEVTSIVARAGAMGGEHIVELADLELVIE